MFYVCLAVVPHFVIICHCFGHLINQMSQIQLIKIESSVCLCFKEDDVAEAQGREDAADRRLQQLQAALSQLETR